MSDAKTSAPVTKKVGGLAAPDNGKVKTPSKKAGKSFYNYKTAVDAAGKSILDDKGRLTDMPIEIKNEKGEIVQPSFSYAKNKPIGRKEFANDGAFLKFRAGLFNYRGNRLLEIAKKLTERSENYLKYGDQKKAKAAAKLDRLKKQMAALEAQLLAEATDAE